MGEGSCYLGFCVQGSRLRFGVRGSGFGVRSRAQGSVQGSGLVLRSAFGSAFLDADARTG